MNNVTNSNATRKDNSSSIEITDYFCQCLNWTYLFNNYKV